MKVKTDEEIILGVLRDLKMSGYSTTDKKLLDAIIMLAELINIVNKKVDSLKPNLQVRGEIINEM